MGTESEDRHHDIDVKADADFDELAARAGAAVRRPAPEHGMVEIARRARRHRVVTALAVGGVTIVLVTLGVAVFRDDGGTGHESPVATTPDNTDGDSAIA